MEIPFVREPRVALRFTLSIGAYVLAGLATSATPLLGAPQFTLQSWKLIDSMRPGEVTGIAVASDDVDDLYVTTTPDGAWQSPTGGRSGLSWLFTGNGLTEVHMTGSAIAESDSLRRYAINVGGKLTTSSNGGQSWSNLRHMGGSAHVNAPWTALAISPTDPLVILGGGDATIVHSMDGAATPFQTATGVPGDVVVTDIEFVSGTASWVGEFVWASTSRCALWEEIDCNDSFVDGRGLLWSADAGQSWVQTLISQQSGDPKNLVNALTTVPNRPNHVYAATQDGLWSTQDFGATWVDSSPPGLASRMITDVYYAPSPSPTLYLAAMDGVHRGDFNGGNINWTLTAFPDGGESFITHLESTKNSAEYLYAGYESGHVYRSNDYGNTVREIDGAHGAYPMATIAVNAQNDNLIYVGTACQQGIFMGDVTSTQSVSWSKLHRPSGNHFHYAMRVIASNTDGQLLFATENNWLWRSRNSGVDWTQITPTPGNVHLHGIAVAPSDQNRLYVANGHGIWGAHTHSLRAWRSDDQGSSWTDVSSGLPQPGTETSLYDIMVHPNDPDIVFIATFGSENYPGEPSHGEGMGVVRSLDGGSTWALVNGGMTGTLNSMYAGKIAMSVIAGQLQTYVTTLDGLYRLDGAASSTWVDISPSGERRFEGFAVDPINPSILYVGTSEEPSPSGAEPAKIFVSLDGGSSWSRMRMKMEPLAWSGQFRVRDIIVKDTRAYAVVEGSGIYMLDSGAFRAILHPMPGPGQR